VKDSLYLEYAKAGLLFWHSDEEKHLKNPARI
jgi:hypothetical protein